MDKAAVEKYHVVPEQFKDKEIVTPERRPLPSNIGRRYQKWYGAARVIIEKNQSARLYEFDDLYHIQDKKEKGKDIRINQLISRDYMKKEEQFLLIDLIDEQFDILAAVPNYLRYSVYDIELTTYSILMDAEISSSMRIEYVANSIS